MKLLIVSQYYSPEQFGVNDISSKLAALGHEITVLTGLPNYPAGEVFQGYKWHELSKSRAHVFEEELNGIKVLRCKLYPRKKGKLNLVRNYLSFAFHSSVLAFQLVKQSKQTGTIPFDRILVTQYSPVTMAIPAIILKQNFHIPMILFCFDLWPESIVSIGLKNHWFIYNIVKYLSQFIYKKADHIITSSRNFENYLRERIGITAPITHIPMYAEDIFLTESDFPKNQSVLTSCNFVFAGNVGKMQSIDTILRAAALIKAELSQSLYTLPTPITIHIVGDGSAYQSSVELARDLGILIKTSNIDEAAASEKSVGVIFHGRHPLSKMPYFYSMADAMLITLKKNDIISNTLPNKVQTYMAAGKPILAAIDGEAAAVIREATCGYVSKAEDHIMLARNLYEVTCVRAIEKDIETSTLNVLGQNSRKYYEDHFTSSNFIKALLQILK